MSSCPNHENITVTVRNGFFHNCLSTLGIVTLIFFAVIFLAIFAMGKSSGTSSSKSLLKNLSVQDGDCVAEFIEGNEEAEKMIAVIDIKGTIVSDRMGFDDTCSKDIVKLIRAANEDENVVAILLNLDTPGGEVTAADEIYHELTLVKKPVVAMMNSMAASGGYYVAAAAQRIVANRLTMTGSIGVIMRGYNFSGLLDFFDIEREVFASGKMKNMLDPMSDTSNEEKTLAKQLVMNSYRIFVQIVSDSRHIPVDTILSGPIGDGRILDGAQALELGLVDRLGYFSDAVDQTLELAKLKKDECCVMRLSPRVNLSVLLSSFLVKSSLPDRGAQLNLNSMQSSSALKPGRLYFLPAI